MSAYLRERAMSERGQIANLPLEQRKVEAFNSFARAYFIEDEASQRDKLAEASADGIWFELEPEAIGAARQRAEAAVTDEVRALTTEITDAVVLANGLTDDLRQRFDALTDAEKDAVLAVLEETLQSNLTNESEEE